MAEWAGHSVDVLLRIYAKCVVARTSSRSAGSAKRCVRSDSAATRCRSWAWARIEHDDLHFAAYGCAQPPKLQSAKIT
ncbi:MAG: hypothetical protein ACR2FU_22825 [Streptosporangiaceae bacterium]